MKASSTRILPALLGTLSLLSPAIAATPPPPEVIVVGDLTKIGRQEGRVPDAANPVYYVPMTPGYPPPKDAPKPEGKQPTKEEVMARVIAVLAKRHYLVAGPGHPPEQAISIWWGTADPELENFGTDDAAEEESFNQRGMVALVGSDKKQELMSWHSKDLRSAQRQERHYVIVMAFDYAAALKKQKKVLWITRMSTPSSSGDLTEVLAALVTTGGSAFGRDAKPAWVDTGKAREGTVNIAPLEVKETLPDKK